MRSKPVSQNTAADVDGNNDNKEETSELLLGRGISPVKIPIMSDSTTRDDSIERSDTHSQSGEDNFGTDSSTRVSVKNRLGRRSSTVGDLTKVRNNHFIKTLNSYCISSSVIF